MPLMILNSDILALIIIQPKVPLPTSLSPDLLLLLLLLPLLLLITLCLHIAFRNRGVESVSEFTRRSLLGQFLEFVTVVEFQGF